MAGANSGSFFRLNFGQTGKKFFQKIDIFEINFFDVSLTKITRHSGNTELVAHEHLFVRSLKDERSEAGKEIYLFDHPR